MAIREITPAWEHDQFNNDQCETIKTPCSQVSFPLDKATKQEVNDLIDTFVYCKEGVGLAAPQVGIRKCFFVFDPKYPSSGKKLKEKVIVAINPKTVPSTSDTMWFEQVNENELVWDTEGCLSLPEISTPVPRLKQIKLKALDINGKAFSKHFEGFPAKIVQHEMDHLYGRIIIDYPGVVLSYKHNQSFLEKLINKLRKS